MGIIFLFLKDTEVLVEGDVSEQSVQKALFTLTNKKEFYTL